MSFESLFKDCMASFGLLCNITIIADGNIHRFKQQDDKGKPCWYWLRIINHDFAIGYFGCWQRDISKKWCSKQTHTLTASEKTAIKNAQKQMQNELLARQVKAQKTAQYIWNHSLQNFEKHPYLQKKEIKSFGARLHKGLLVIPLENSNNEICSLQFIDNDGAKRFLTGGQTKGCYFMIGIINYSVNKESVIYISEGFATSVAIYEATGCAVIVAFYANNLLSVAKIIREKYPTNEIIVCADNDQY